MAEGYLNSLEGREEKGTGLQGHRTLRTLPPFLKRLLEQWSPEGEQREQAAGRLPCHEELCLHAGSQFTGCLHLNAVYQSGGKTEETGKLFQDQLV